MIVDTMMRLKPVAERTSVTVHFLELDQHLVTISYSMESRKSGNIWLATHFGFSISNGSSNVTKKGSSCFIVGGFVVGSIVAISRSFCWSGTV